MAKSDSADQVSLNIHQRIHAVMAEVDPHIEKDGAVEIRGTEAYKYVSHDAVTNHVRGALLQHGVMVHPTVTAANTDGNRCELEVEVDFINADDPSDRITVRSVGYGVDNSDKGPGKAWSYALKYAYLKLFMLNSADDIEAVDFEHDPAAKRQSDVKFAESQTKTAQEAWAYSLKDDIGNVKDMAGLKELKKIHKEALNDAPAPTVAYFNAGFAKREKELEPKKKGKKK